jgi:hypothetical protein
VITLAFVDVKAILKIHIVISILQEFFIMKCTLILRLFLVSLISTHISYAVVGDSATYNALAIKTSLLASIQPLTTAGRQYLNVLLETPIHDQNFLQQRQDLLKALSMDLLLSGELERALRDAASAEIALHIICAQHEPLEYSEARERYTTKYLNDSPLIKNLFVGRYANSVGVLLPAMAYLLPESLSTYKYPILCGAIAYGATSALLRGSPRQLGMAVLSGVGPMVTCYGAGALSVHFPPMLSKIGRVLGHMVRLGSAYSVTVNHEYRKCYPIESQIRLQMVLVARYIRAAQQLKVIVEQNTLIQVACPTLLATLQILDTNEHASALLNCVQSSTFDGDASFFSNVGRVMVAYNHCLQCKEELTLLMQAVGLLDVYNAVAGWIASDPSVCFAEYRESDFSFINLSGFVHPALGSDAVANDWSMGNDNPAIACITGLNRGGKSVSAKGVLANAWLAQTLCVSIAQQCQMTPFATLMYVERGLDIVGDASTYEAEVEMLGTIIESARSGDRMLVVLNELLSSTDPVEGKKAFEHVLAEMSALPNLCVICVTHYKDLSVDDTLVAQFHVGCQEVGDGSLVPAYHLEPGQSLMNDAVWLIDDRLKQLKEPAF